MSDTQHPQSNRVVTNHAVEQYRRRHRADLDYDAAQSELEAAMPGGVFQRDAYKGKVYLLPALACYAIMIDEGPFRTMITVLPKHVFVMSPIDRKSHAAELRAASEAMDAARAEQVKAKGHAKTLRQAANIGTPGVTDAIAKTAAAIYRRTITEADARQAEVMILRAEMRLANEQGQADAVKTRAALAIAVRELHACGEREGEPYRALAEIGRLDPYFTAPAFYDHPKTGETE